LTGAARLRTFGTRVADEGGGTVSDQGAQPDWRYPDDKAEEFTWAEITPPRPRERHGQHTVPFRIFLIHVKTGPNRRYGEQANNDPVGFFMEHIEDMGLRGRERSEIQAHLIRVNAELPANAKWVRLVATVATNSPVRVTIVHYKDQDDYEDDPPEDGPVAEA
jgi:hypothetical protein